LDSFLRLNCVALEKEGGKKEVINIFNSALLKDNFLSMLINVF